MSTLSVIGTPIGNLGDITLRALDVLRSVDLILCEDTRTTKNLLTKHGISTKTMSYHMHSKISRVEEIIGLLKEGKNIALVSDAGTPGISDPGAELVAKVRKEIDNDCLNDCCDGRGDMPHACARGDFCGAKIRKIKNGDIKLEAIPGPSAFVAALSIAGVPCADFTFLGFFPHKKGRETLFKEIAASERTMVFYESPHRIMKTLESLVEHLEGIGEVGETVPDDDSILLKSKKVTVCKELTKIFEEVISGTASEVKKYFESNSDKIRGEFVVIVSE